MVVETKLILPNMKINLKKIILFGFVFCFLSSCNPKLQILADGWTKITTDKKNYKNQNLFDIELLKLIDTNAIYKECCFIQSWESSFIQLHSSKNKRTITYPNNSNREYYRFYSNGFCNSFINDKVGESFSAKDFNPDSTGYRGVFYKNKKQQVRIDLFTQTSGMGSYSNLKLNLKFSGDTIFMSAKNDNGGYRVFVKKAINADLVIIKGWKN
jgi:hypothetical protein